MAEIQENIQLAADVIFKKYDKDLNGFLDTSEITLLLTEARRKMGDDSKVTKQDVEKFMGYFSPATPDIITNTELARVLTILNSPTH